MDADIWEAINKDRADFNDLEIHLDQVEPLVSGLLYRVNLQTKAKLLLYGLGPVLVRPVLVVALQRFSVVLLLLLLVLVAVLATVVLGFEVGDLGGNQDIGERIRVRIQLEAVDGQSVGINDSEIEFEMARVVVLVWFLVVLGLLVTVVVLFEDRRASRTFESHRLCLRKGDGLHRDSLERLDFIGGDLGYDKESVGNSTQAGRSKDGSQQHCCFCGAETMVGLVV